MCLSLRRVDKTFQMISSSIDLVTNLELVSGLEEKDAADHAASSSEFSTSVYHHGSAACVLGDFDRG